MNLFASSYVSQEIVGKVLHNTSGSFQYRFNSFDSSALDSEGINEYMTHALILDLNTYLVSVLNRQDKMSMAASIESRVPLLDHRLVEFSLILQRDFVKLLELA